MDVAPHHRLLLGLHRMAWLVGVGRPEVSVETLTGRTAAPSLLRPLARQEGRLGESENAE
jgi:hypothetical protein